MVVKNSWWRGWRNLMNKPEVDIYLCANPVQLFLFLYCPLSLSVKRHLRKACQRCFSFHKVQKNEKEQNFIIWHDQVTKRHTGQFPEQCWWVGVAAFGDPGYIMCKCWRQNNREGRTGKSPVRLALTASYCHRILPDIDHPNLVAAVGSFSQTSHLTRGREDPEASLSSFIPRSDFWSCRLSAFSARLQELKML